MNPDQVRADQHRDAQRRTLSPSAGRHPGKTMQKRKPFVPKGHDAILNEVQANEGYLTVTKMGDGSEITGKLIARDKYTITLLVDGTRRVTLYKHAVESFEPVELN